MIALLIAVLIVVISVGGYFIINSINSSKGENTSNEWCEPVSDEEYDKL